METTKIPAPKGWHFTAETGVEANYIGHGEVEEFAYIIIHLNPRWYKRLQGKKTVSVALIEADFDSIYDMGLAIREAATELALEVSLG